MASASLTSLRLAERRQGPVELRRAAAPLLYFAAVLQNLAHLVARTYGPLAIRHGCAWIATRGSSKYPEQVRPVGRLPQPGRRSAATRPSSYDHAADHAQAEERTDECCRPSEAGAAVESGRRGAYFRHDSRAGGLD